jgi:hypothetical protein
MSEEFEKTEANTLTSSKGFSVKMTVAGGVLYRDANGEKYICSEWLVKPPGLGIILYKGSPGNRGFDKMEQSGIDTIFSNVARALEYLGDF